MNMNYDEADFRIKIKSEEDLNILLKKYNLKKYVGYKCSLLKELFPKYPFMYSLIFTGSGFTKSEIFNSLVNKNIIPYKSILSCFIYNVMIHEYLEYIKNLRKTPKVNIDILELTPNYSSKIHGIEYALFKIKENDKIFKIHSKILCTSRQGDCEEIPLYTYSFLDDPEKTYAVYCETLDMDILYGDVEIIYNLDEI